MELDQLRAYGGIFARYWRIRYDHVLVTLSAREGFRTQVISGLATFFLGAYIYGWEIYIALKEEYPRLYAMSMYTKGGGD